MRQRFIQLMGVAVAVLSLTLVVVRAQTQGSAAKPAAAKAGPALKTSWGEPDIQGIWSDEVQIPLQRPAKYAGKEFFTDAELVALDKERAAKPAFGDKRAERGTESDVAGAYNSEVFLTRRHTGRRTSLIVDPPDGRIPPLTPEVVKRQKDIREFQLALLEATDTCKNKVRGCEGGRYTGVPSPRRNEQPPVYMTGRVNRSDGPEDRGLSERCMTAVLPDFSGGVGNFRQITQSPGSVSIFYDTGQGQGWHRTIPIDGSAHLPSNVRLWWGDSRGHWEGNTLVVDVTNFSPQTDFQGARQNLHLVERWTRIDKNTVEYVVTIDDKTTWTKPWTVKEEFVKQSDSHNRIYKEPRCHEGNFGMVGMLAGVRAQEVAFGEGRGPDPARSNVDTPTNAALDDEDLDDLHRRVAEARTILVSSPWSHTGTRTTSGTRVATLPFCYLTSPRSGRSRSG